MGKTWVYLPPSTDIQSIQVEIELILQRQNIHGLLGKNNLPWLTVTSLAIYFISIAKHYTVSILNLALVSIYWYTRVPVAC